MRHHALLFYQRLFWVLDAAQQNKDNRLTETQLIDAVIDCNRPVFTVTRRDTLGNPQTKFLSQRIIREYIRFLRTIRCLDAEYRVVLPLKYDDHGFPEEAMQTEFANQASQILSEAGADVNSLVNKSKDLLWHQIPEDVVGELPTVERIYQDMGKGISYQDFKWLIYLYTLRSDAHLRWKQVIMLLPKQYVVQTVVV